MNSIESVAQAGLRVESQRLAVSANNVANTLSRDFVPSQVQSQATAGGGVEGTVVQAPRDVQADGRVDDLIAHASRTDLVNEVVTQSMSSAAFKANLATLKTDRENFDALISIKG